MVLAFQISKNVLSGMRHFIMWSLFLSKLLIKSSISLQFFVSLLLNNSAAQWVRTLTTYDTKKAEVLLLLPSQTFLVNYCKIWNF